MVLFPVCAIAQPSLLPARAAANNVFPILTHNLFSASLQLWRLLQVGPRSVELHEAPANQTSPCVAYLYGPINGTAPAVSLPTVCSHSLWHALWVASHHVTSW